jgi:hypothetical protein
LSIIADAVLNPPPDVAEAANKLRTGPKGNSYAECETIGRWYLGLTDTGATK